MTQHQQLRFYIIMAFSCSVILLSYREDILGSLLAPLTMMTARTTLSLLHWMGIEAVRTANLIYHPDGFVYEIYYRCTGFLPAALLTVAMLSYPRPLMHKICGLAVGVFVLWVLNLTRLVHLFFIGVYYPAAFEIVHTAIWQGLIILVSVGIWLGWINWTQAEQNVVPV